MIIIIIITFAGGVKETFRIHSFYCAFEMSPPACPPILIITTNIIVIIVIIMFTIINIIFNFNDDLQEHTSIIHIFPDTPLAKMLTY